MAVENLIPFDVEISDGSKVDYDFSFKIFTSNDILVYKESSAGVFAQQTQVSDWTPGDPPGTNVFWLEFDASAETGTVHLSEAASLGMRVIITRNTEQTQPTVFSRTAAFSVKTLENAIDRIVLLIQEISAKFNRVAMLPSNPPNPTPIEISSPIDERGLKWRYDPDNSKWLIESTSVNPDDIVSEVSDLVSAASASASAAASSASSAASSASSAASSASAAAASAGQTELSGTLAERPESLTYNTFYWATDVEQYYRFSVNAGRWFLIG